MHVPLTKGLSSSESDILGIEVDEWPRPADTESEEDGQC